MPVKTEAAYATKTRYVKLSSKDTLDTILDKNEYFGGYKPTVKTVEDGWLHWFFRQVSHNCEIQR